MRCLIIGIIVSNSRFLFVSSTADSFSASDPLRRNNSIVVFPNISHAVPVHNFLFTFLPPQPYPSSPTLLSASTLCLSCSNTDILTAQDDAPTLPPSTRHTRCVAPTQQPDPILPRSLPPSTMFERRWTTRYRSSLARPLYYNLLLEFRFPISKYLLVDEGMLLSHRRLVFGSFSAKDDSIRPIVGTTHCVRQNTLEQ